MKKTTVFILSILISSLYFSCTPAIEKDHVDPELRIEELGIDLVIPTEPANIKLASRVGKIVYVSGHGPVMENGGFMIGKVGEEVSFEQAKEAARLTGISILGALKGEIGDLNKVKKIVKVLAMVNAVPEFDEHITVVNAFSELMVEVFGPSGKHARSAIGLGSLPRNIPIEIEMIVELKD